MIVQSIRLHHFRNYDDVRFEFSEGLNVITGKNAQGKTNLLESLVYLSLTRSHRIMDEKKLIQENALFADIQCNFIDENIERNIEAVIHQKGKTLMVHHQPVKKSSEFVGMLNVVLFSPDDLTMFSEAPKERRRIMNQEITKISNPYLISLSKYQSLLKERNLLLKNRDIDQIFLNTLDEEMSRLEVLIMNQRKMFVEIIDSYINDLYKQLSDDDIDIHVKYKRCMEEEINYENILKMHLSSREKDLEYHVTTFGIHREDMIFEMENKNLIQIASQGQKRMTILAFKMSLLKYIQQISNKTPVLLLDDVLSELDDSRQKRLIEMVKNNYQCLITTTNIPSFLDQRNIKIFEIKKGNIVEGGNV